MRHHWNSLAPYNGDEGGHRTVPAHCRVPPESERLRCEVDEAGHGRVPAHCSVPTESERHAGGEVDEGGHRTVPAHCRVPPESERLRREVDEGWGDGQRSGACPRKRCGSRRFLASTAFGAMGPSYTSLRSQRVDAPPSELPRPVQRGEGWGEGQRYDECTRMRCRSSRYVASTAFGAMGPSYTSLRSQRVDEPPSELPRPVQRGEGWGEGQRYDECTRMRSFR